MAWFGAFALPLNTCLFLFRADAVFGRNWKSRMIFSALWLTTLSAFAAPFSFSQHTIGETAFCIIDRVGRLNALGSITMAVFDTMVYLAVTYKIVSRNFDLLARDKANRWWRTSPIRGMGHVSGALLLTSQIYYLYALLFPKTSIYSHLA